MLLYLRISSVDRGLRHAIYYGIIFQALFYAAIIGVGIGALVECNGLSQLSNQFCINFGKPVVILIAAVNVITDFYVLALPIRRVLKLQLSFKRKLGLLVVFAGGLVYVILPDLRL